MARGGGERSAAELFRAYDRSGDFRIQQELVCHFLPLARKAAGRFVRDGVDLDDLVQSGTIGLINAVRSYDPRRGVAFEAYALRHIDGEIRHLLRDGGIYRLPRWLPQLYRELTAAVATLQQRLGRTPTVSEIAAHMNLRESGVLEILHAYAQSSVRLIGDPLGDTPSAAIRREEITHQRYVSFHLPIEDRVLLLDLVGCLADMQRKVIYYLFFMDLTQTEAARQLRISQKHVSRVLADALTRLGRLLPPGRTAASPRPSRPPRWERSGLREPVRTGPGRPKRSRA